MPCPANTCCCAVCLLGQQRWVLAAGSGSNELLLSSSGDTGCCNRACRASCSCRQRCSRSVRRLRLQLVLPSGCSTSTGSGGCSGPGWLLRASNSENKLW